MKRARARDEAWSFRGYERESSHGKRKRKGEGDVGKTEREKGDGGSMDETECAHRAASIPPPAFPACTHSCSCTAAVARSCAHARLRARPSLARNHLLVRRYADVYQRRALFSRYSAVYSSAEVFLSIGECRCRETWPQPSFPRDSPAAIQPGGFFSPPSHRVIVSAQTLKNLPARILFFLLQVVSMKSVRRTVY